MKTKPCALCKNEVRVAYRVQIKEGKTWMFVCAVCIEEAKRAPAYRYGGTWNGARH